MMGGAAVRVGIIGAGTISQAVHIPGVLRLANRLDLRVVCDLSPGRAAEVAARCGARPESDPAAVLGDRELDAVVLATPGSHGELTRAALAAGKHVLAEKPLCLTVAEAGALGAQAAERGLVLQVGYMKMHDPAVTAARDELARLGGVRLVRVTVLHPATPPQVAHLRLRAHRDVGTAAIEAAAAYEQARTRDALGDVGEPLGCYYRDVLAGSVIHELSVLRALGFTLPDRFTHVRRWPPEAAAGRGPEPPSLLATAPLGDDVELVLNWNWLPDHPEYGEEVAVFARDGRLRLDLAAPYHLEERSTLRVERADGLARHESVRRDGYDSGFLCQLECFAEQIGATQGGGGDGPAAVGKRPAGSDAAGAAADLRCLQALAAAVAAGDGISVGGEAAAHA